MGENKTITLANSQTIPVIGFGTWQLQGDECREAVKSAIKVGYRHIDTADGYKNHNEVAEGIAQTGIDRKELFITTKVPRDFLKLNDLVECAKRYLKELRTDYLDLLLIHWPNPEIPIQESLTAMKQLQDEGIVRSLGVSNFTIPLLTEALATGVQFVINQVEFHPSLNQIKLKEFCDEHQVVLTAYSPIAQGQDLTLPIITELAEKYNKTASQIILNWLVSKQMVVIPRSSNPARILENFGALDFELESEDSVRIDQVGGNNRIVRPSFAPFED